MIRNHFINPIFICKIDLFYNPQCCKHSFNSIGLDIYFNQLLIFGNQKILKSLLLTARSNFISITLYALLLLHHFSLNIIHMTHFLRISILMNIARSIRLQFFRDENALIMMYKLVVDFFVRYQPSRFFSKFWISSKSGIAFSNSKSVRFYSKSS